MVMREGDYAAQSDTQLIAAANEGDEAAFAALYHRHRDWVLRLAVRFTGNSHDALDVAQETFAYLAGKLPHLKVTAAMTTFLYPVVRNLSLALLRKRRRTLDDQRLLDEALAPVAAARDASRAELAAVFGALSAAHREVVLMRFVDDMTLEEIAEALGVPLGTVKSRLHYSMAALREDPRTLRFFEVQSLRK
jgi:RNA polymerase sigma-70 factor (ECF subfamily)